MAAQAPGPFHHRLLALPHHLTPLGRLLLAALHGTWVLVEPDPVSEHADPAHADAVADTLRGHGATAHRIALDAACAAREVLAGRLAGLSAQDRTQDGTQDGAQDGTATDGTGVRGVVSLLGDVEAPTPGHPALPLGAAWTLALVQALTDPDRDGGPLTAPVWSLTRGAVGTGPADPPSHPVRAIATGIGWTAALEHPRSWGGTVDLPPELDRRAAQRLVSVLAGAPARTSSRSARPGRWPDGSSAPPPATTGRARGRSTAPP